MLVSLVHTVDQTAGLILKNKGSLNASLYCGLNTIDVANIINMAEANQYNAFNEINKTFQTLEIWKSNDRSVPQGSKIYT